jgi:hypothetical protein
MKNVLHLTIYCQWLQQWYATIATLLDLLKLGPGNACVTLNGRVNHFMKIASSNNTHNCGLTYFIFNNLASHALSLESRNVNKQTLNDIAEGLKCENPYCMELR